MAKFHLPKLFQSCAESRINLNFMRLVVPGKSSEKGKRLWLKSYWSLCVNSAKLSKLLLEHPRGCFICFRHQEFYHSFVKSTETFLQLHCDLIMTFWMKLLTTESDKWRSVWAGGRGSSKGHKDHTRLGKAERTGFVHPCEKRRNLITTFQPFQRTAKERRLSFYMGKVRGDGNWLLLGRFWIETRGKILTMRTLSHWSMFPRKWWTGHF